MPGSPEEQRGGLSGYSCVNEEAPLKDENEHEGMLNLMSNQGNTMSYVLRMGNMVSQAASDADISGEMDAFGHCR